jgi:hypothetical protein
MPLIAVIIPFSTVLDGAEPEKASERRKRRPVAV